MNNDMVHDEIEIFFAKNDYDAKAELSICGQTSYFLDFFEISSTLIFLQACNLYD